MMRHRPIGLPASIECRAARDARDTVARVIIWADGEVTAIRAALAREPSNSTADAAATPAAGRPGPGLHRPDGRAEVGDRVLLNVAALDRGLGTGGTRW